MSRSIDFLGIGGHACGSTKLYQLLKAHPSVGFVHRSKEEGVDIRGKECHYWDRHSSRPLSWYLSYFKWEYPCVGEITPAYARLNEETVARVHAAFPNIHVFFLMRETLARTWSNVRKNMVKQGVLDPSLTWMISQASEEKTVQRNDYVRTVRLWNRAYGDRFHVIRFDRFVADPRSAMSRVADWLGIDPAFYDAMPEERVRMRVNPTPALPMPDAFAEWFRETSAFTWESQLREIESMTAVF